VLLTDPALAGSDTLVTARVLRRAVERLGGDLVLMGRWSTDSETGQVPPQLAELLDRPFLPAARRLARSEGGLLDADVDTEDGWAGCQVPLPAVVSVGEKITKIRKLLPEEVAASAALSIDVWSVAELGLDPALVGLAASPTYVRRLVDEASGRTPHVFDTGTVPERVEAALGLMTGLLERPTRAASPSGPIRPRTEPPGGRFLVLVSGSDGRLALAARDVVGAVRREHSVWSVEAVWVGAEPSEADRRALGGVGADRLWASSSIDRPISPERAAGVLGRVARSGPEPVGLVVLSDLFGRSVAGRLSAREGWGLTGDATGIERAPDGRPLYRKPAFGGRWIAEIGTRAGPAVATVRPGALPRLPNLDGAPLAIDPVLSDGRPDRVAVTGGATERDGSWGDALSSPILLVAGQGVGGPDGVRVLREAARSIGAAVGATRRVVDLGWAPRQLQVGLTGLSVEPRVALLFGVGGSPNHLIGLQRAGVIVAVNSDAAASVFRRVDVGVVGAWQEVLPLLVPAVATRWPELLSPSR